MRVQCGRNRRLALAPFRRSGVGIRCVATSRIGSSKLNQHIYRSQPAWDYWLCPPHHPEEQSPPRSNTQDPKLPAATWTEWLTRSTREQQSLVSIICVGRSRPPSFHRLVYLRSTSTLPVSYMLTFRSGFHSRYSGADDWSIGVRYIWQVGRALRDLGTCHYGLLCKKFVSKFSLTWAIFPKWLCAIVYHRLRPHIRYSEFFCFEFEFGFHHFNYSFLE